MIRGREGDVHKKGKEMKKKRMKDESLNAGFSPFVDSLFYPESVWLLSSTKSIKERLLQS